MSALTASCMASNTWNSSGRCRSGPGSSTTVKLRDAYDKGEHAVAVVEVKSFDESGQEVAYNEMISFLRGCGGWGGDRGPSGDVNVPPGEIRMRSSRKKRPSRRRSCIAFPAIGIRCTSIPILRKAFGFDRPILHGLCTFGYAGRHVLKAMCGGDPRRFKSIKVRFGGIVYPGETLVTRMWKETDHRVLFETSVKERDKVVIKSAAVELWEPVANDGQNASRQTTGVANRNGHKFRRPAPKRFAAAGVAHRNRHKLRCLQRHWYAPFPNARSGVAIDGGFGVSPIES